MPSVCTCRLRMTVQKLPSSPQLNICEAIAKFCADITSVCASVLHVCAAYICVELWMSVTTVRKLPPSVAVPRSPVFSFCSFCFPSFLHLLQFPSICLPSVFPGFPCFLGVLYFSLPSSISILLLLYNFLHYSLLQHSPSHLSLVFYRRLKWTVVCVCLPPSLFLSV